MQCEWVANNKFRTYGDYTDQFYTGRRVHLDRLTGSDPMVTVASASLSSGWTVVTTRSSSVANNVVRFRWGIPSVGPKGSLPAHTHTGDDQGGLITVTGVSSAQIYAFAFGGW